MGISQGTDGFPLCDMITAQFINEVLTGFLTAGVVAAAVGYLVKNYLDSLHERIKTNASDIKHCVDDGRDSRKEIYDRLNTVEKEAITRRDVAEMRKELKMEMHSVKNSVDSLRDAIMKGEITPRNK